MQENLICKRKGPHFVRASNVCRLLQPEVIRLESTPGDDEHERDEDTDPGEDEA